MGEFSVHRVPHSVLNGERANDIGTSHGGGRGIKNFMCPRRYSPVDIAERTDERAGAVPRSADDEDAPNVFPPTPLRSGDQVSSRFKRAEKLDSGE